MNIINASKARSYLEAHYAYKTSHPDAASNYSVLFGEQSAFNLDVTYAIIRFSTESIPPGYVEAARIPLYGGEMECQLPAPAPKAVRDVIASTTKWIISDRNPDLAYTPYPDIDVICYLPKEPTV